MSWWNRNQTVDEILTDAKTDVPLTKETIDLHNDIKELRTYEDVMKIIEESRKR